MEAVVNMGIFKNKQKTLIKEIYDAVVALTKEVRDHIKDFEKHRDDDEIRHEEIFRDIANKITNHNCALSVETKEVVQTLVRRTDEQNGHLKDLAKQGEIRQQQGEETQRVLGKVLYLTNKTTVIAESRKSMWREISLVTASLIGVFGFIAMIVFGILKLIK